MMPIIIYRFYSYPIDLACTNDVFGYCVYVHTYICTAVVITKLPSMCMYIRTYVLMLSLRSYYICVCTYVHTYVVNSYCTTCMHILYHI